MRKLVCMQCIVTTSSVVVYESPQMKKSVTDSCVDRYEEDDEVTWTGCNLGLSGHLHK